MFPGSRRSKGAKRADDQGAAALVAGLVVLLLLLAMLIVVTMFGGGSGEACVPGGGGGSGTRSDQPDVSSEGEDDIPEDMLEVYRQIGRETNVPWSLLAAVGKVESDHGRDERSRFVNDAGAIGPMQFGVLNDGAAGNAWSAPESGLTTHSVEHFGHETFWDHPESRRDDPDSVWRPFAADGDGDGDYDVRDKWDAVKGAAGYLLYLGIEDDVENALALYNADSTGAYADKVLEYAENYSEGDFNVGSAADGEGSRESCGDDALEMSVEPQDFDVDELVNLPPDSCAVPGAVGGTQQITPLTCAAHKVIYDRFQEGVYLVHAGRCPPDGFEHPMGQAMDYMINNGSVMPDSGQKQHGDAIAEWVMTNHEVLGVMYVIWYNRVWFPSEGVMELESWRGYGGSGPTLGHYDHVHVSFNGPRIVAC